MARRAVLCALVGAAQAFSPGPVPGCLAGLSKVPATTGAQGVAAPLRRSGLHPGRLPRRVLALRMSDSAKDKEMEELLKKRVELLREKEELLRERKEISIQSNSGPLPEIKRPSPPAKRAEEMISSANGNIFQFILSYPRLEKLAYMQFSALFENGSIVLRKQLLPAIEREDWKTVMELCEEDGAMEQQLLQPMLFWATTSVDDPNEVGSGAGSYIAAVQEVLTGAQASIDLIYDAADKGDKAKAQKGWAGLKERANAFVKLANQRMPEESTPLSEIR